GSEKLVLREVFTSVQDSGSLSGYICTYVFVRFSSPCSHREIAKPHVVNLRSLPLVEPLQTPNRKLIMESEFLDKVEDNRVVRIWSKKMQLEKGESLTKGYTSELLDFTYINVTQNNFQELKEIWAQWDDEVKQLFFSNYALAQFWNPAYSCFTFGEIDLVPTIEKYTALLRCPRIRANNVYSTAVNVLTFLKKLVNILGMSEQWVSARIKQKGENKCIPWKSLHDLILAHPDTKKKVDIFALSIYGLMNFPRALGYIDEAVTDLFDQLDKRITPVPAILAETFRYLSTCRSAGEGRFIGCAQLLLVRFRSHFWKVDKVSYQVFSKNYSPLKELAAMPIHENIIVERWIAILQNLKEEDVEWKATWMVLKQYGSRQLVPATQGLAQCEFSYKDDGYKKKIREMTNAWKQTHRMK
ncbi:hypothetical protein Goshw_018381, partial [Gossypium schwendimanii]|nr:hypothetical protein [Gossypium schwendimanii]